mmetsp:Transcript_7538/g.11899  ORF Transcript_7538/g.11899 Transcript_7538/m.11899 type:complete len:104 (-) Transcript_7538:1568-1879(-)
MMPIAPQRSLPTTQLQSWSSVEMVMEAQKLMDAQANALGRAIGKVVTGQVQPFSDFGSLLGEIARPPASVLEGDATDIARNVEYIRQLVETEMRSGIPAERIM